MSEKCCDRCLYTTRIDDVMINEHGICNYCVRHDGLELEYPNDDIIGKEKLNQMFNKVRFSGIGKQFDCVVGISGGTDSSFLLDLVCRYGLRPLAVHFDNGWDTNVAKNNMECVCKKLNVPIECVKVNSKEFDDIVRSFIIASVADIDAASDIGMITAMYKTAEKYGLSYIIEGHSFRTEGIQPISWAYVDGEYINSVHEKYGRIPMKTFPNLWYDDFKRWVNKLQIKRLRPLYYYPYIKTEAKEYLKLKFGWKTYDGHHLENEFTAFNYTYYLPKKMNVDERVHEYSALIRSGQLSKSKAIALLNKPIVFSEDLVKKVINRLSFSADEFESHINSPLKTYKNFSTYKPLFEKEEPFWREMYENNIVPKSFYLKYCSPSFDGTGKHNTHIIRRY